MAITISKNSIALLVIPLQISVIGSHR